MKRKTFYIKIIYLFIIFIFCLSSIISTSGCTNNSSGNKGNNSGIIQITAPQVYEIISNGENYYVIDVRTKEEYLQGHLGGAVLIPVDEIKNRLKEIPKDKPLIVYCKSGVRSMQAANILVSNGFKAVYNMTGGIDEWQKEGYPVVQDKGANQDTASENQGFTTLSVDEVYKIVKNNEDYLIIDVRSIDEYKDGHIKGAVSIPVSDFEKRIAEIPKDKPIIVYCNGSGCNRSITAAKILVKYGFKKVYNIGGTGINEWKDKGYPYVEGN
ncbi:MAG: rhodanese-like domain-containing protein [Actinobacteria bacterium]|nr:rhodanese-like domain-containing protein [Actinomycetota bacterium]